MGEQMKIREQKGFTLVELMVSTFVLVTVMGSAMYALTQAQAMSAESRQRLLAMHAARTALETAKNTALGSITSINTTSMVPTGLTNGQVSYALNPSNLNGVSVATVSVTVTWTGPKNMSRNLTISTMRSIY